MTGPLTAGDLIGERYEVRNYVGEGGMQFVYAAHDRLIDRVVALKTPKNASAAKRFRRSAVVAAKVNHPNVAKTLDYVRDGNARYLIEELVEGEDLQKALLKRTSFLDPYSAARIFHHLAKGVAAAHHAGVVHRDLKPTNVMVVGGYSLNDLKITDFGIAKMAGEELAEAAEGVNSTITTSQTAVGALPYMAPEVIDTPRNVAAPADIWSVGAMMFHLICGEQPYGSGLKAVGKILAAETPVAPPFLTSNPQFARLASDILELALACLKKDPGMRPTADDLVARCGQFCYTSGARQEGVVKRIEHGAWGFIETSSKDVFFHISSVYGPNRINVGDHVVFSAYGGGGAPRAYPILILTPAR